MAVANENESGAEGLSSGGPEVDIATAVAELPAIEGPACESCGKLMPEAAVSVCPCCGYYASLGICVDVDEKWEQLANGQTLQADEEEGEPQSKSHLQVWLDLMPSWGWTLIAGNASVVAGSVAARILLPSGTLRTSWSMMQLFAGFAAFMTCHICAYLMAIAEDASLGVLDVVLKPLGIWKDVVRGLPDKLRIALGGSCGLTALFGSLLIIGGLPYGALLDWGVKERPKQSLLGAVLARAQEVEAEEKELGEAVEDFAGTAGNVSAKSIEAAGEEAKKGVVKNVRVDCIILGYTKDARNHVASLVLAREFRGKLIYVGRLTGGLSDQVRYEYAELFEEIPRDRPFVTVPAYINALWLQPKYACRVKCSRETASGKLVGMELDRILGALD